MEPTYSSQVIPAFCRFFEEKTWIIPNYVGNVVDVRVNDHNFNPIFLRISGCQSGDVFEVPSLINNLTTQIDTRDKLFGEHVVPLTVIGSQARRTADSVFKYFFQISRRSYQDYLGLKKAITSKGEVYYGAPGLILNSNFEPIAIGLSEYTVLNDSLVLNRHVLKVSPNVFTSEGLLEKVIIKRLIPFFTRHNMEGRTVRVEIDDISQYIVKPVIPNARVQESMKDILHTYKDEILNGLL